LTRNHPRRVDGLRGPQGDTSVWAQGRGCAQTDASKGLLQRCALSRNPKPSVLSVRIFSRVACVEYYKRGRLPLGSDTSEERDKPMSSQPIYEGELPEEERSRVVGRSTRKDDDLADDELPRYDDGTLSDIVRKPTRAAADLDQYADLEDDLDAVLADERAPTDREMIKEILERVRRIEEKLEQGDTQVPPPWATG